MQTIHNPILKGFSPDPSICRAGGDYYIATSTFEWYPGVAIHHSRDLVHWRLAARPLARAGQLDLRGTQDSGGVWAPDLTFARGRFWLVYTDMRRRSGSFKDGHNFLVTAPAIDGPWSDPVDLGWFGFDPALFHGPDGRIHVLMTTWDHRDPATRFAGIALQEYDPVAGRLTGARRVIFRGSALGLTEGPHLYHRDGWYYLLTAEGGTGYGHAATLARSRDLFGPYELHPDGPLITARDLPDAALQRAGHGDIVETPAGETYLAYLCSRPLPGLYKSPLGRETALQRCLWGEDGWLRLETRGPQIENPGPALPPHPFPPEPETYRFDGALPLAFLWLRSPRAERLFSLAARPGHLRLYGRESLGSWHEQALVALRQQHHDCDAETTVEAAPESHAQFAGLVAYYNRHAYYHLGLTRYESGRCLQIHYCNGQWPRDATQIALRPPVPVGEGPVDLRAEIRGAALRFFWRQGAEDWRRIGPVLDHSALSDEGGQGEFNRNAGALTGIGGYTGAMLGMSAHDLTGAGAPADFSRFTYRPA